MKNKTYIIILLSFFMITSSSCDRLDVSGMFLNRSNTEERVSDWLKYNEENGDIVIDSVSNNYSFYATSDSHYSEEIDMFGDNDRIHKYVTENRNDSTAVFSIIAGDLVNTSGEESFKIVKGSMSFHPETQKEYKPCFTVIGNHDIYFDCAQYYKKYFNSSTYTVTVKTLEGKQDLYIFLDSGNGTHGSLQMEWLKKKLSYRNDYRHCVVVSHNWLFRIDYDYTTTPASNLSLDEQYDFMNIMSEHDVDMVLMGHFHSCEQHNIDGVTYIMTDNLNQKDGEVTYLSVRCGDEIRYEYKNIGL